MGFGARMELPPEPVQSSLLYRFERSDPKARRGEFLMISSLFCIPTFFSLTPNI